MGSVKHPAVAGLFYPNNPDELRSQIASFLAEGQAGRVEKPKALIAPHAGYIYSGATAGHAYAQLKSIANKIKHVVILAPSHHLAFPGIGYSSAEMFQTPIGNLKTNPDAIAAISALPQVNQTDEAFEKEHSIEVHLPFLQMALGEIQITPLLVSDAVGSEVAEVLEQLWGGDETLIVISSDLSHYLDYQHAQKLDREATQAIEQLEPNALASDHACGRTPISGLLIAARNHHLNAITLDLRNSGDTAGSHSQVVGYGAYAFA
ncbi:AmmeMemoRadiSam system protein B [Pseudomonadota bacterium]